MGKNNRFKREWQVLRMVWKAAKGQHSRMALALVLELAIGLFPPAAIYILQRAAGIHADNLESLFTQENILWALLIYFIYILATKVTRVITACAVAEVDYGIRCRFSEALQRVPYEKVMSKLGIGSSNGLTQETAMASSLVPLVYRSFIRAGITVIAFCVLMVVLSPRFFLIVLLLTATLLLSITLLRKRLKSIYRAVYDRMSSLYGLFAEWVSGYRIYRVYGSMDFATARMRKVFREIRDLSRRLSLVANSQSAIAEMLTYALAAIIIVLMPNTDGLVDISLLMSYPVAILFIRGEMLNMINGYQQLATTESSISRLFGVLEYANAPKDEDPEVDGIDSIRFQGVDFSYKDEKGTHQILSNASLQLCRGELNVITGPSGTGKTTTLNLILGLLHPDKGSVERVRRECDSDLHGVGLVEQEPFIFDGTLYDNLVMGRRGISEDKIMEYIGRLGLDHVFPDKESLHEGKEKFAARLSSGEKQRLALIRALLGRPALLIVDEATSNIDAATSRIIIDYIKELSAARLVVAVSHDPDFIAAADKVIKLEETNTQEYA